jgi:cytochrome c
MDAKSEGRMFTFNRGLIAFAILLLMVVFAELLLRGARRTPDDPMFRVSGGDVERGRTALVTYGCGACHVIPGVRQANGRVGPQLVRFREQIYIAGTQANVPENLVLWIQAPQDMNPGTAMPDLGVSEADARDMAAYLYSVR